MNDKGNEAKEEFRRRFGITDVAPKREMDRKLVGSQNGYLKSELSMLNYQTRTLDMKSRKRIQNEEEFKKTIMPKSVKHVYLDTTFYTHGTEHMRDEVANIRRPFIDQGLDQYPCGFGNHHNTRGLTLSYWDCCHNYQNVIQDEIRHLKIMLRNNETKVLRKPPHYEDRSHMLGFVTPNNFYKPELSRHNCQDFDFAARRCRSKEPTLVKAYHEMDYYNGHFKKMNIKRVELPIEENFRAGESEEKQEHRIQSSNVPHETFVKCADNLNDLNDDSFCRTKKDCEILRARILYDIYKYGNSQLFAILLGDGTGIKRGMGVAILSNGRASSERIFSSIKLNPSMRPTDDSGLATITVMSESVILYILSGKSIGAVFAFKRKTRVQLFPEFHQKS
ncbi:MAG: hypothetical protein MHMPM18_001312 [Marteilia pararefringens]